MSLQERVDGHGLSALLCKYEIIVHGMMMMMVHGMMTMMVHGHDDDHGSWHTFWRGGLWPGIADAPVPVDLATVERAGHIEPRHPLGLPECDQQHVTHRCTRVGGMVECASSCWSDLND